MERGEGYNQQYQQPYNQDMPMGNMNVNMNMNGNLGVEKKGDLGKTALILIIMGLFCCGITTIPGIICAIIAFIKDKHNATNIAAMVIAFIEIAIIGLLFIGGVADGVTKNMNVNEINATAHQRIFLETKEDNGTQIYNKNDIEIYYNGIGNGDDFKIFAKNNSDKDIIIECNKLLLNGYDFTSYMRLKVTSGTKANDTINLSLFKMSENDIDPADMSELEGIFTIYNKETNDVIDTFDFSIK